MSIRNRFHHHFQIQNHNHPANDVEHQIGLRKRNHHAVEKVLEQLKNRTGRRMSTFKRWHVPKTAAKSVQGPWQPEMFQPKKQPPKLLIHGVYRELL